MKIGALTLFQKMHANGKPCKSVLIAALHWGMVAYLAVAFKLAPRPLRKGWPVLHAYVSVQPRIKFPCGVKPPSHWIILNSDAAEHAAQEKGIEMIDTNELRRLTQAATPGPWHATKSVETNSWAVWSDTTRLMELRPTKTVDMYRVSNTAAFIAAANPAAISELLDRLEAAEKAVTEAYQRGYATGQEESEKERDALRAELDALKESAA